MKNLLMLVFGLFLLFYESGSMTTSRVVYSGDQIFNRFLMYGVMEVDYDQKILENQVMQMQSFSVINEYIENFLSLRTNSKVNFNDPMYFQRIGISSLEFLGNNPYEGQLEINGIDAEAPRGLVISKREISLQNSLLQAPHIVFNVTSFRDNSEFLVNSENIKIYFQNNLSVHINSNGLSPIVIRAESLRVDDGSVTGHLRLMGSGVVSVYHWKGSC